jgi:hypothetical protein
MIEQLPNIAPIVSVQQQAVRLTCRLLLTGQGLSAEARQRGIVTSLGLYSGGARSVEPDSDIRFEVAFSKIETNQSGKSFKL